MSSIESEEARFEQNCAAARRYVDAINRQDLEGVLACYADDAEIHDPVGRRDLKGKAALREFYQAIVTRTRLEIVGPISGSFANAVALPLLARIPGAEIDVITVTRFNEDGLIQEYSAFWCAFNMRKVEGMTPDDGAGAALLAS